uniref:carbohydrate sulfotransferase 6-like n=1 Tax=Myxine glutinosa TaxID=7769 RepID=UPI00358FBDD2
MQFMLKISQAMLALSMVFIIGIVYFLFTQPSDNTNEIQIRSDCGEQAKPKQTHTLIISTWRSGSSFLGQIFGQHPDVFYLMEPCWHVWTEMRGAGASVMEPACRDMLRSIYLCDTSVYNYYFPPDPPPPTGRNLATIFMHFVSRALCSPPACDAFAPGTFSEEKICKARCSGHSFERLALACQASKHIVLKEVRFFDIEPLASMIADPSIDIRIIHLVRDPRAVALSREKAPRALKRDNGVVMNMTGYEFIDSNLTVLQEVCKSTERMRSMTGGDMPFWIRGRYMLVRFEDLVLDPEGLVKKMYNFAGIPENKAILHWVVNVTHGDHETGYNFDTVGKNAMKIAQKWRTTITLEKVLNIQKACGGMMKAYGYLPVKTQNQLQNLDLKLVDKVPI